jgi:hypothetical protein
VDPECDKQEEDGPNGQWEFRARAEPRQRIKSLPINRTPFFARPGALSSARSEDSHGKTPPADHDILMVVDAALLYLQDVEVF